MMDWLKPIANGGNYPEFFSEKAKLIAIKRDPFTGQWYHAVLPVTEDQFNDWCAGDLIQNAMPNLNADQREFLMTGITPDYTEILYPHTVHKGAQFQNNF